MPVIEVVLLLILLAIIYYFAAAERFWPCSDCNNIMIPKNGMIQLNPFSWPYNAFANPDNIYLPGAEIAAPKREVPLTHMETPDHAVLTN